MLLFVIAGIVVAGAVLVVSYPLVLRPLEPYAAPPDPEAEYSDRDALLEAMSELEVSQQTGKLSQADYEEQKNRMERQYLNTVQGAETAKGRPVAGAKGKRAAATTGTAAAPAPRSTRSKRSSRAKRP